MCAPSFASFRVAGLTAARKASLALLRAGVALGGWGILAGCQGPRTPLAPAAEEARHIASLWWIFMATMVVIYLLVLFFLGWAIRQGWSRRRREPGDEPQLTEPGAPAERRLARRVGAAVVASLVALLGLLVADFSIGRALQPPERGDALTIRITGHQWWWEIEYLDRTAANVIVTANELHLPVGRPVQLLLESADVIHSFWLPNLQGKRDLIPGKSTSLWLHPERAGVFLGQCAEFCGHQHAHMGLLAVVEPAEEFARWQEAQRRPAREPVSESERRGRNVFLRSSCVLCHAVQGTPAGSRFGPSLTHLASRRRLAANAFPNERGYLAGWILDPQGMKPGVRMPAHALPAEDFRALLDYLESLQ